MYYEDVDWCYRANIAASLGACQARRSRVDGEIRSRLVRELLRDEPPFVLDFVTKVEA